MSVIPKAEPLVLVAIADGIEEIEAVTIVDVLARAGAKVTVASVENFELVCSRGVRLVADCTLEQIMNDKFDLIVLPGGGKGAMHLRKSEELLHLLTAQHMANRLIGAICAAPAEVLAHYQFLTNRSATCYPGYRDQVPHYVDEKVVVDEHFITSQGPATAMLFALTLVEKLFDLDRAQAVAHGLLFSYQSVISKKE